MKCIWCELETTTDEKLVSNKIKYANKEHIFPESVGGKCYLEIGKVCQDCNKRLGDTVDKYLKTKNFMMLKQYQDSSKIIGKPVGKVRNDEKNKKRKIKEITNISGYGGGFQMTSSEENSSYISFTNLPDGSGGDFSYNDNFSKALHKCAINILYNEYDYIFMKSNFGELIDFVNNENNQNYQDWSYSICYSKLSSMVHFEPYYLPQRKKENIPIAIVLIFPCGIFIVSTKPKLVNIELLHLVSNNIPEMKHWEENGLNFINHYTNISFPNFKKTFGKQIKFTLVKKEIDGKANPDDCFYMLTQCKTCGQTNPTVTSLDKEIILNGDYKHTTGGNRNSWNKLLIKDLSKRGLVIEKWDKESLQNIIDQGVIYPIENDIKKMNIANCFIKCINCLEMIEFDAKDCFI